MPPRVFIPMNKGNELSKHGYHLNIPALKRHQAIDKIMKKIPKQNKHKHALMLFRKLNVLYIYNRKNKPKVAAKAKADRNYIRRIYMK